MGAFFASRVVYYPGCGNDGHAIKLFGGSHAAHCFVYADYGRSQAEVRADLNHPTQGLRGYQPLTVTDVHPATLVPGGWDPLAQPVAGRFPMGPTVEPYALFVVVQRSSDVAGVPLDDAHGPVRLAILFLGADGFTSYASLFGPPRRAPFGVLIQDHGFGGNYDQFGSGGLLEQIAQRAESRPELLLAPSGSAWSGYRAVKGVDPEAGGRWSHDRHLHEVRPTDELTLASRA